MAAESPLAERRIVEIKMGRSKFPGKPAKIGNRKRVNLSSCTLPEENESSKAAENIYLGLSMFNEAFGDNEMIPPGPFQGFSTDDVEIALAEARLQQKESELEYKKHGMNINLQDSFQSEFTSIVGCFSLNGNHDKNKTRLCFDGGGVANNVNDKDNVAASDSKPSNGKKVTNTLNDNVIINKNRNSLISKNKLCKTLRTTNTRKNLFKISRNINPGKSLQSRAAKKLLQKAKMSNLYEQNKSNNSERKFIWPTYSLHSQRVIKPNKKFIEGSCHIQERILRARLRCNTSQRKSAPVEKKPDLSKNVSHNAELIVDVSEEPGKKLVDGDSPLMRQDSTKNDSKSKLNNNCSFDTSKSNVHYTSTGRSILREPKLQLNRINLGLMEGPFSSSLHSSSLSPNSQLNVNPSQISTMHRTLTCGVCGYVKFYKFVEVTKMFGIYCCEECQKFISKTMKSSENEKNQKLQCLKRNGLCTSTSLIKSCGAGGGGMECQACWLKLCVKNLKLTRRVKAKLCELLPTEIQFSLDPMSQGGCKDDKALNLNRCSSRELRWLSQNESKHENGVMTRRNMSTEKKDAEAGADLLVRTSEKWKQLRLENTRAKEDADSACRQRIELKGPRVKNVCRSASVVLGQPIATFPRDSSPKKSGEAAANEINKSCDKEEAGTISGESQGILVGERSGKETSERRQASAEKRVGSGAKSVGNGKASPGQQNNNNSSSSSNSGVGRTKKKSNVKTENPISIDFWETYDPDEVGESGFGLIGSESFSVRALCFLCGSSGQEKMIHCASCCEPYHDFCVSEEQGKLQDDVWKYDWVCPRCTICFTCGKTSGQQLKCVKCDNSYHTECVDRVGGRLLHSPDRPWVCSVCLRCKSCNGVDVSVFVGNLPLCRTCFVLRQKGNYCPLCQRCYEDDDYDSKMMECGQCKCWVHAKCEGLSDEKYQVLSFLPESVEYICRMCCVMPPAPWWIAVEAELKSGYLGVLKALSKNRRACAMLKWSPRKQCICRQMSFTPRALDFEEARSATSGDSGARKSEQSDTDDKSRVETFKPAPVLERKTSIEVINHSTGSLKMTLKIMKGTADEKQDPEEPVGEQGEGKSVRMKDMLDKFNIKDCSVLVKKCSSYDEMDSQSNSSDSLDNTQQPVCKSGDYGSSNPEHSRKGLPTSPVNPSSDSGLGSTDDELKANSLTDEESCRLDYQGSSRYADSRMGGTETSSSLFDDKNECVCFLEVDTYNSRSKPFSPSLLSIKKKVTTSEYSSLQQFHMDMQRMIATTQSTELMEMYHQTLKEIFPWFDPKFSRVYTNSQKISGNASIESTPVKNTPTKSVSVEDCKVPKSMLIGQPLEYYYSGYSLEDCRSCLMCKGVGDGAPNSTGRLLYCGQNEWVHCNCALWSAEVFEEIDGSLQNVHSAISRGRSIRCPECNSKGASIGCCARNCAETFHFTCARKAGCAFMDDKTVYCPAHVNETKGKVVQNEKEFEIRRPVYVELDKRKMKGVDSSQVRFAVGALQVENLGHFVKKLSDHPEAIIPDQFRFTRLFWSCYEPWRIVKYNFSVRLQEDELDEGIDLGINLTVDHSNAPEVLDLRLQQLRYFQKHHRLLEINEPVLEDKAMDKRKLSKCEGGKHIPPKRPKKDHKIVKKIDFFDPREDESCLSDGQNTADLIPPELEEAIFKDLPNDILDGISMQDIFMDIKNDMYENTEKEVDSIEVEELIDQSKAKKVDASGDGISIAGQPNELWAASDDSKQSVYDWTDETCPKFNRDLKRSRSDVLPTRRNITLKNNQRSCTLNWNCKMDIHTTKWKRNTKSNPTGNLLESQERGNTLQEWKYPDGLVMLSTDSIASVKDLKDRLALQQEEGKENKCLPWHMKLQPRLLQVDGGVDSSSSGSEAGESPQRLIEENMVTTQSVAPPQTSSFSSNMDINTQYASSSQTDYAYLQSTFTLPQIDGVDDSSSDDSDFEYFRPDKARLTYPLSCTIPQLDGSADPESEGEISRDDGLSPLINNSPTKEDEPVKCNQCRCTYRTKISYERHLENCSNDYILFSSDGEGSEEENPFHSKTNHEQTIVNNTLEPRTSPKPDESKKILPEAPVPVGAKVETPRTTQPKVETKKEKTKRQQTRKRSQQTAAKKSTVIANSQNVQQILVQQSPMPPAVILQDITQPNLMPGTFIDTGGGIQYVASLESQTAFTKPQLIAAPSPLVPGGFHIQPPESQLIPSLPVLPQNVQTNLPGIIIQQPPQVAGTLISPQATPVVMSGDQMMLGAPPLLEVIHDPQTGGMFLASHNQPVFYNMETIVSNTVMQTNQYVSNVMTTSSFSQTSTQVVQTSKLEQVVNVPSNFIFVGQNATSDKIISSGDIICLPPQPLLQNQAQVQTMVNPLMQTSQAFAADPKIMSIPGSPAMRCVQPVQAKRLCPPSVVNKTPSKMPCTQSLSRTPDVKPRSSFNSTPCDKQEVHQNKPNSFRSMPMMRPNVTKSPPRQYEKAVIVPKPRKQGSRAIVDFINNFKSDTCDVTPAVKPDELQPPEMIEPSAVKEFSPVSLRSPVMEVPKPIQPEPDPERIQLEPEPEPESVQPEPEPESEPKPNEEHVTKTKLESPRKEEIDTKCEEKMEEEVKAEDSEKAEKVEGPVEEKMEEAEDEPSSVTESQERHGPNQDKDMEKTKKDSSVRDVQESDQSENLAPEAPAADAPVIANDLPLQETSPSSNNTLKTETKKEKSKLFASNQNCVTTKLVTIHPRLIQNPDADADAEAENKKFTLNTEIGKPDEKGPRLIFDVTSDDGFKSSSTSMAELWARICDAVQEMRAVFKIPPLPASRKGHEVMGMQNHGLQHCLEQLRGVEHCVKYKCKYFVKEKSSKLEERVTPVKENLSGCARTESFSDRKEYDMFAWLASRHRRLPKVSETSEEVLSSARRAISLPMAMRYRHLRETAKTYVGVYRSKIHGKGLFCLREIEAGEMVIEYAGEVIRSNITDKREKYYTDKGIGCYMFRIDDHFVVDATMKGNAARFINHSCEPNCYSRVVDILGKKHIVIFALRRIHVMEELTYDYKFPFEDEKISCHCLSKKCRKYLN